MAGENSETIYKSPIKKLLKHFEKSRDSWKARALEKQKKIDFLEKKLRDTEKSREKWKGEIKELKKKYKSEL